MRPTRMRGFSEPYGSWKTICIRRRAAHSSRGEQRRGGRGPRSGSARPIGSMSRRISRPVVDLPQPDSPTSAERLARLEGEAHAVDRADRRARGRPEPAAAERRSASRAPATSSNGPPSRAITRAGHEMPRRAAPRAAAPPGGSSGTRADSAGRTRQPARAPRAGRAARPRWTTSGWPKRLGCGRQRRRPRVYGWSGRAKMLVDRRHLDDAPGVDHGHAVAQLGDHAEIVGDHEHRHAALGLQPARGDRGSGPGW